jgi:hypothetical protein
MLPILLDASEYLWNASDNKKTRKALCYAGFLDFVGHCWTDIWAGGV